MKINQKLPLILAALLVLWVVCVPGTVCAQASSTTDACAPGGSNSAMDTNLANAAASAGTIKQQAVNNALSLYAPLDIKAQYCWNSITSMFSGIGGLSDPLGLVWKLVQQQLMALANQVCSAVLSAANQIKTFALSQLNNFCVPLPNFGLGAGFNLGLQGPACNGTQLLQVQPNGPYPNQSTYDPRSFFQ